MFKKLVFWPVFLFNPCKVLHLGDSRGTSCEMKCTWCFNVFKRNRKKKRGEQILEWLTQSCKWASCSSTAERNLSLVPGTPDCHVRYRVTHSPRWLRDYQGLCAEGEIKSCQPWTSWAGQRLDGQTERERESDKLAKVTVAIGLNPYKTAHCTTPVVKKKYGCHGAD